MLISALVSIPIALTTDPIFGAVLFVLIMGVLMGGVWSVCAARMLYWELRTMTAREAVDYLVNQSRWGERERVPGPMKIQLGANELRYAARRNGLEAFGRKPGSLRYIKTEPSYWLGARLDVLDLVDAHGSWGRTEMYLFMEDFYTLEDVRFSRKRIIEIWPGVGGSGQMTIAEVDQNLG